MMVSSSSKIILLTILVLGIVYISKPTYSGQVGALYSQNALALTKQSHLLADWLYLQLLGKEQNPYGKEFYREASALTGNANYIPPARINPPWYYIPFAPLALLSPWHVQLVVSVLLIFSWIATVTLSYQEVVRREPSFWQVAVVGILFAPFVNAMLCSQISPFQALLTILSLRSWRNGDPFQSGLWMGLLSMKPHSSYLIAAGLTFLAVRDEEYSFLLGGLCSYALLVAPTLTDLALYSNWIENPPRLESMTLTSASFVRRILLDATGKLYNWPIFLIPLIAISVLAWSTAKGKLRSYHQLLVLLPCLSILTAPYGWLYDMTILIPANCFVFQQAQLKFQQHQPVLIIIWILLNLFGLFGAFLLVNYLWLLVLPLGLTLLVLREYSLNQFGF